MSETATRFDLRQGRILACLMEKQLTTPNTYPLTLNSLMLACNQKSNREPVMQLTEGDIGHVCNQLAADGWLRVEDSERARKYSHLLRQKLELSRQQQALLCMMMLRAPLTLNDLKRRTERMAEFADVEDVQLCLMELMETGSPLVLLLPKGPGRREDRYTHTFGDWVSEPESDPEENTESTGTVSGDHARGNDLISRIEMLEKRVLKLESQLTVEHLSADAETE
ncbi:MAG: YceH family protein [Pseudomonadota bacterium]